MPISFDQLLDGDEAALGRRGETEHLATFVFEWQLVHERPRIVRLRKLFPLWRDEAIGLAAHDALGDLVVLELDPTKLISIRMSNTFEAERHLILADEVLAFSKLQKRLVAFCSFEQSLCFVFVRCWQVITDYCYF